MRTVKEVSKLTGVIVRTLHYYDAIGLLEPTKVTDAGYRMYDDSVECFSQKFKCDLTIAENCEHWFHTEGQLKILNDWAKRNVSRKQHIMER